jgi:hypothetical protein
MQQGVCSCNWDFKFAAQRGAVDHILEYVAHLQFICQARNPKFNAYRVFFFLYGIGFISWSNRSDLGHLCIRPPVHDSFHLLIDITERWSLIWMFHIKPSWESQTDSQGGWPCVGVEGCGFMTCASTTKIFQIGWLVFRQNFLTQDLQNLEHRCWSVDDHIWWNSILIDMCILVESRCECAVVLLCNYAFKPRSGTGSCQASFFETVVMTLFW